MFLLQHEHTHWSLFWLGPTHTVLLPQILTSPVAIWTNNDHQCDHYPNLSFKLDFAIIKAQAWAGMISRTVGWTSVWILLTPDWTTKPLAQLLLVFPLSVALWLVQYESGQVNQFFQTLISMRNLSWWDAVWLFMVIFYLLVSTSPVLRHTWPWHCSSWPLSSFLKTTVFPNIGRSGGTLRIYNDSSFSEISLLADFHSNNRETEQLSIIEQSSALQLSTLLQWTLHNQSGTAEGEGLFIHPSIYLFIHPSTHLHSQSSIHPSTHPASQPSIYSSIYPSVCPSIHPSF